VLNFEDLDTEELALLAGDAMQEIQNRIGNSIDSSAKVRFPRGFIHTAIELRALLPDIGTRIQKQNASYLLMMTDVFRWLAIRTDISGAALSSIVKEAICIYGVICDWMLKEATKGHCSRRSYTTRTSKLVELEIIDDTLRSDLDWIWQIRCNEHFHEVDELEHEKYSRDDHNRARKTLRRLIQALKNRDINGT